MCTSDCPEKTYWRALSDALRINGGNPKPTRRLVPGGCARPSSSFSFSISSCAGVFSRPSSACSRSATNERKARGRKRKPSRAAVQEKLRAYNEALAEGSRRNLCRAGSSLAASFWTSARQPSTRRALRATGVAGGEEVPRRGCGSGARAAGTIQRRAGRRNCRSHPAGGPSGPSSSPARGGSMKSWRRCAVAGCGRAPDYSSSPRFRCWPRKPPSRILPSPLRDWFSAGSTFFLFSAAIAYLIAKHGGAFFRANAKSIAASIDEATAAKAAGGPRIARGRARRFRGSTRK